MSIVICNYDQLSSLSDDDLRDTFEYLSQNPPYECGYPTIRASKIEVWMEWVQTIRPVFEETTRRWGGEWQKKGHWYGNNRR